MLFIFDKDGTLCYSNNGHIFISDADDQRVYDKRDDICRLLKYSGHKIAIASNQGGIAFGHTTKEEVEKMMQHVSDEVGADFSIYCPFHPNGTVEPYDIESKMRKPGPLMLNICMDVLGFKKEETFFIGDRKEDELAAKNAGVTFFDADIFFEEKWKEYVRGMGE